jgi:hypothetical protein
MRSNGIKPVIGRGRNEHLKRHTIIINVTLYYSFQPTPCLPRLVMKTLAKLIIAVVEVRIALTNGALFGVIILAMSALRARNQLILNLCRRQKAVIVKPPADYCCIKATQSSCERLTILTPDVMISR